MGQILTVANQKGGSGKTTTVAAIAQAAQMDGKRVLAIDLDPQGNLSYTMGADLTAGGAYEMLMEQATAAALVQETSWGVDIIPASWSLQNLATKAGSGWRLKKATEQIRRKYDLIIIDTPPTPGELQYNAILASTDLVITTPADPYGLQGLYQIMQTAFYLRDESNPRLRIKGVVLTRYSGRSTLTKQMADVIKEKAGEHKLPVLAAIREAVAVREAAAMQKGLLTYAPTSKPAEDYKALYARLFKTEDTKHE